MIIRVCFLVFILAALSFEMPVDGADATGPVFPPAVESYGDGGTADLGTVLRGRIGAEPFNLAASIIFFLAILHTFLAPKIRRWVHRGRGFNQAKIEDELKATSVRQNPRRRPGISAALLHLLGEVEAIFGLWVLPLAVALVLAKGPGVARNYLGSTLTHVEPLFVVVIMAIAASRPVVELAMRLLGALARNSPARWWFALLTIGPLLGSLITEPAAMTICAVLLGREFYRLKPGTTFMYATLGLLFVNVSVGGALTNFAAPPILMVAGQWHWSSWDLLTQIGGRAVLGIVLGNLAYFAIFRREFDGMAKLRPTLSEDLPDRAPVPFWITLVHVGFLGFTVLFAHDPAFFLGGFLFFLAFTMATKAHQNELNLRQPMLVGFFLAGLVVHGGLQGWWIEPVLSRLSALPLLVGATVLTAFNDNAAITYLATLVPDFTREMKEAVVSGAICGGGLTVIANAPNPAGQSLLQKYFPEGSISPGGLFLAALAPTLIMLGLFALPR